MEIWELLPETIRAEEIIKIDFNHLYLNQLKQALPIKRLKTIDNTDTNYVLGFYYIKFYMEARLEPILPSLEENFTQFKTGYGEGVYWVDEIKYFISLGGQILEKKLLIAYKESKPLLKPLMEDFYKIPKRLIRKQLANQFFGNLGRRS